MTHVFIDINCVDVAFLKIIYHWKAAKDAVVVVGIAAVSYVVRAVSL